VLVAVILGKSASPKWICADSRHICTLSIANVLYLAKEGFNNQGYISLNNLTRPFWRDILGDQYILTDSENLWTSNEKGMFGIALQALMDTGDRFMTVSKEYAPDGRMSEQIDRYVLVNSGFALISRNDGSPVGARDLTWSYASFLEAARARERAVG
jgi:glucoamylase